MNLGERINIIVSEFDGVRDGQPIVWECNAGNTAGFTEDKARQLSANGGFGKVFVGSISASCLTEITPWGKCETEKNTIKNRAGVRFTPLYSDSFKLKSKTVNFDDHLKHELAQKHSKEVAQAERVEKYKRELLDSREARFYRRFREMGATHDEAVSYVWGEK